MVLRRYLVAWSGPGDVSSHLCMSDTHRAARSPSGRLHDRAVMRLFAELRVRSVRRRQPLSCCDSARNNDRDPCDHHGHPCSVFAGGVVLGGRILPLAHAQRITIGAAWLFLELRPAWLVSRCGWSRAVVRASSPCSRTLGEFQDALVGEREHHFSKMLL